MTIIKLKNITYDLVKMERSLVFQILEQDDSWRWIDKVENDGDMLEFISKNGLIIQSATSPEIGVDYILLQGSERRTEDMVSILDFDFNKKRDKYYNLINQALKEWDNHVEQLKEKTK